MHVKTAMAGAMANLDCQVTTLAQFLTSTSKELMIADAHSRVQTINSCMQAGAGAKPGQKLYFLSEIRRSGDQIQEFMVPKTPLALRVWRLGVVDWLLAVGSAHLTYRPGIIGTNKILRYPTSLYLITLTEIMLQSF